MWRFFRFGIKSNNCHGNQAHFRAIGTTCANAECDDRNEEQSECLLNKENFPNNLAAKFASKHLNFLHHNAASQLSQAIPFTPGTNKLKYINESLNQIQWREYMTQRDKIFTQKTNKENRSKLVQTKQNLDAKKISQNEVKFKEEKFGSLSKIERKFEEFPEDEDDLEHPLKETFGERLTANEYGRKMLDLCKQRKVFIILKPIDRITVLNLYKNFFT